jgi:hypothetical protein
MTSSFNRSPGLGASRAGASVALMAAAFAMAGCFDVHDVDPGFRLIDNFDDGYFPSNPSFTPWMCYAFNPVTNQNFSCAQDADTPDGNGDSLRLDVTVDDAPDGSLQYGGAALVTYTARGIREDFTTFTTLVFDAELQSGTPPLASDAKMSVQLGCSTAQLTDGSVPGDLDVKQGVPYSSIWQRRSAALANFGGESSGTRKIKGGAAACLRLVDSIHFQIEAHLPDGQSGKGTLKIDNIYLQ